MNNDAASVENRTERIYTAQEIREKNELRKQLQVRLTGYEKDRYY